MVCVDLCQNKVIGFFQPFLPIMKKKRKPIVHIAANKCQDAQKQCPGQKIHQVPQKGRAWRMTSYNLYHTTAPRGMQSHHTTYTQNSPLS
jgi:hypothetical protein